MIRSLLFSFPAVFVDYRAHLVIMDDFGETVLHLVRILGQDLDDFVPGGHAGQHKEAEME
jgi:hypothetical protein